jgi:hypothetical protein
MRMFTAIYGFMLIREMLIALRQGIAARNTNHFAYDIARLL